MSFRDIYTLLANSVVYCHIVLLVNYTSSDYCLYIIFYSVKCNTTHKKILLTLHLINILLFSFWFFKPDERCDADIMERHYTEYGGRMEQIYRNLYDKMTPGCYVEIEFEHGDVSIFHFSNGGGEMESNWEPSEEK